jgi:uncharacterized protein YbcV (DUF1398 family)
MSPDQVAVIDDCALRSLRGEITFAEAVRRLADAGVERYHADYSRLESTYYFSNGSSHVVPLTLEKPTIADAFSAGAIASSIRQSQQGQIAYPQFVRQSSVAGCVGYFVHLTGRQVTYFGRRGEQHIEAFPAQR